MFNIQEELKKLPDKPGVYLMKDANGEVIYVGKAVSLKNRVKQYFQSQAGQSPKVQVMVQRIAEFEYIVTDSELEAFILECNLIKKYKPRFNVLLKDDKTYPYIKVTMNEEYPRILMTRRVEKDGAKYFGPYASAAAVRETIDLIKRIFPVKTCKKILPRDIGKGRPCLNYFIYRCLGPCQGDVDKEQYRSAMKDICSFLGGKQEEILKKLEKEMNEAAEAMDFEKAARLRDKINSIRLVSEKQKVLSTAMEDQDVIAFAREQTDACVQVFFIRGGKLIGREHFIFEGIDFAEDGELLGSFVKQFYNNAEFIPGEIILQEDIEEKESIEKWLGEKRSARVRVTVPRRGEKRQLVEMVSRNALIALRHFRERLLTEGSASGEALEKLAEMLGLEDAPHRIEAYDISNTGSTEVVASMVVFEGGKPAKKQYRRFRMKTVDIQDDYASMQETVYRRLKRAGAGQERHAEEQDEVQEVQDEVQVEERVEVKHKGQYEGQYEGQTDGQADDSFSRLPDLVLVDGGLGHVNAVRKVVEEFGLDIPVYGMVKDDRHRTRGLVGPGGEMDLSRDLVVLRLVTAIQDEAHRFALEYNKKLRKKRITVSVLDQIEGIGAKRKKALIKHFGSVSRIKEAGVDDLAAVEGISRSMAEKIYAYFHD